MTNYIFASDFTDISQMQENSIDLSSQFIIYLGKIQTGIAEFWKMYQRKVRSSNSWHFSGHVAARENGVKGYPISC